MGGWVGRMSVGENKVWIHSSSSLRKPCRPDPVLHLKSIIRRPIQIPSGDKMKLMVVYIPIPDILMLGTEKKGAWELSRTCRPLSVSLWTLIRFQEWEKQSSKLFIFTGIERIFSNQYQSYFIFYFSNQWKLSVFKNMDFTDKKLKITEQLQTKI